VRREVSSVGCVIEIGEGQRSTNCHMCHSYVGAKSVQHSRFCGMSRDTILANQQSTPYIALFAYDKKTINVSLLGSQHAVKVLETFNLLNFV